MTQASDLAAELDAEINDLAAACSATGNPNPLVTEVLDRMRATSAQLASVKADSKPEPQPQPEPERLASNPTPAAEAGRVFRP